MCGAADPLFLQFCLHKSQLSKNREPETGFASSPPTSVAGDDGLPRRREHPRRDQSSRIRRARIDFKWDQ